MGQPEPDYRALYLHAIGLFGRVAKSVADLSETLAEVTEDLRGYHEALTQADEEPEADPAAPFDRGGFLPPGITVVSAAEAIIARPYTAVANPNACEPGCVLCGRDIPDDDVVHERCRCRSGTADECDRHRG